MITSKFVTVKDKKIDFPMTRERYLSTWKVFRSISDENIITANHILSLPSWDQVNTILDLGCGDGLITKSIVLKSPEQVDKVILVDPDKEMLDEAYIHLTEIGIVPDVERVSSKFEDCVNKYIAQTDIVLAVHLVYLITPESFRVLIDSLPVGKKMILVLDHEGSVFTKLWKHTAPKYAHRSAYVRKYLDNISSDYSIQRSVITSKIINPLKQRPDIKDAILSLMCYSDYSLMGVNSRQFVDACVASNVTGRFVECASACYEIFKLS